MAEKTYARATPRQQAALLRKHSGLHAETELVGRWPFRRREWRVLCHCGWKDPRVIPVMPAEMALAERFLLLEAMERHLTAELAKLTFADIWLSK